MLDTIQPPFVCVFMDLDENAKKKKTKQKKKTTERSQ